MLTIISAAARQFGQMAAWAEYMAGGQPEPEVGTPAASITVYTSRGPEQLTSDAAEAVAAATIGGDA